MPSVYDDAVQPKVLAGALDSEALTNETDVHFRSSTSLQKGFQLLKDDNGDYTNIYVENSGYYKILIPHASKGSYSFSETEPVEFDIIDINTNEAPPASGRLRFTETSAFTFAYLHSGQTIKFQFKDPHGTTGITFTQDQYMFITFLGN